MSEAEWLACEDPGPMLKLLGEKVTERKLWLFTVWCCRSIWRPMRKRRSRKMVEVTERYLEGIDGKAELDAAFAAATAAFEETPENTIDRYVTLVASVVAVNDVEEAEAVADHVAAVLAHQAIYPDYSVETTDETQAAYAARVLTEKARQCRLLRCVIGNPCRTAAPHPAWRTASVLDVAEAAYEERVLPAGELDGERLAVLADALEEAGCTEAGLLGHLREHGPHARGCWPVDLVLERR
jgi:hypothetical protein